MKRSTFSKECDELLTNFEYECTSRKTANKDSFDGFDDCTSVNSLLEHTLFSNTNKRTKSSKLLSISIANEICNEQIYDSNNANNKNRPCVTKVKEDLQKNLRSKLSKLKSCYDRIKNIFKKAIFFFKKVWVLS